jgi:adenylate cyclase
MPPADNVLSDEKKANPPPVKTAKKGGSARAKKIISAIKGLGGSGRPVAFLLLLVLCFVLFQNPEPVEFLRLKTFDIYQNIKPRDVPEQRVVTIVDLDEESLATVGQWPWPRTIVADLIDKLTQMGAITIGFDIVFAEPDRMSPALVAGALKGLDPATIEKLKGLKSNDEILAEALKKSRVVVGQSVLPLPDKDDDRPVTSIAIMGPDPKSYLESYPGMVRNLKILDEAAMGHGVFNVHPEADGVVRRVPSVVNVAGQLYPALSVELLRLATGNQTIIAKSLPGKGMQGIVIRPKLVNTDPTARIWVNFSLHDQAKYVSAKSVLDGTVDPAKIANKIILIGTSAVGLLDIKTTPVDKNLPGVEVHAQIIETILSDAQLQRPLDAQGGEISSVLLAGAILILLLPIIGARWTMLLFLSMAGGIAGYSWYQYAYLLTLYDAAGPILVLLIVYIELTYSNFTREEQKRREVRAAFSRYLSPAQVEKLAADPSKLQLGGEIKDMTLLFCDVRGFTTISEQFDAQGLTRLINRFLTPMTEVILARQGTIDKYMGDCIMAFWNAPEDDPEHARHACESALVMTERLVEVNKGLEADSVKENRKHIPINIGIGLNSGNVCVGNMGSDQRFDYSVLGDNVNLASRLEGQSKTYGVTMVIGENTQKEAPDYASLELDLIKVKGKHEAVRIFTLVGRPDMRQDPRFQALEVEHIKLLDAYRGQRWAEARALLATCRELGEFVHLGKLYDLYEERMDDYEANPPGGDWDGVYVAKSK